jgi:hypothetical protein
MNSTEKKLIRRKKGPTRTINGAGSSTAASKIIDAHYEEQGVRKVWSMRRVERLARTLNLTLQEIASLVAYPHSVFLGQLNKGKLSGPTCVLLTLIEHAYLSDIVHDTIDLFNFDGRPKNTKGDGVHILSPT